MANRVLLLVGTKKGAFILESDAARDDWALRGPLCEGWPVHDLIHDPGSGTIYAAAGSPWYGGAVWRSKDLGESWSQSSAGLTYGDDGPTVTTIWSLATAPDGTLLAGVEPAGLFSSADGGAIYAAAGSPWYGGAVWRSDDLGESWSHSSAGLTYGDDGPTVTTIWSLATAPDGTLLAGVEPAGLFSSADGGATWRHVEGLTNHPTRPTWGPGAGGLILHTIIPHPTDTERTWVGISAVGVFETRDGGGSWLPRNVGVRAEFNPENRFPETGQCVHKFAMAAGEPETLYQRNHCGVYRSDDGSETWHEITDGLPTDFGFAMVAHPRDPATCWVIPLSLPEDGRYMPGGHTAVWRTHDRGASWICSDKGLPTRDAYMSVLREAMARDKLDPVGVTFGTETGQLWHSADGGESWRMITDTLPEIWSVEAVVLDG